MTANTPTLTGTATKCFSDPSLPNGLVIELSTCVISGTPTGAVANATYTVTASIAAGENLHNVDSQITVNVPRPDSTGYDTPSAIYTVGSKITANISTLSGTLEHCVSDPSLPDGLLIESRTCVISGTPTGAVAHATYTITASNAAGEDLHNFDLQITENVLRPDSTGYDTSPAIYTVGSENTANTSTLTGLPDHGVSDPSLPEGLVIVSSTCVISGTPTGAVAHAAYTITASNEAGDDISPFALVSTGTRRRQT